MQLNPIHDRAIDLFVAGKRAGDVARELNVSLRSLRRWNNDPDFAAELQTQRNGARNIAQTQAAIALQEKAALMHAATETFFKLLDSDDLQTKIRILTVANQMMMQERRLESAEEWRRFVYFDKLSRNELATGTDEEADCAAPASSAPTATESSPSDAESGQLRPKADTPPENVPSPSLPEPPPAAEPAPATAPLTTAEEIITAHATAAVESAKVEKSWSPPKRQPAPFYARVARR